MVKFNGYSIFDVLRVKICLRIYIFQTFDVENSYSRLKLINVLWARKINKLRDGIEAFFIGKQND